MKNQPTRRALHAVARFRLAYGDYEAHIFASFLRDKRKHWSRKYKAAFSRAYVATKDEPFPLSRDVRKGGRWAA